MPWSPTIQGRWYRLSPQSAEVYRRKARAYDPPAAAVVLIDEAAITDGPDIGGRRAEDAAKLQATAGEAEAGVGGGASDVAKRDVRLAAEVQQVVGARVSPTCC